MDRERLAALANHDQEIAILNEGWLKNDKATQVAFLESLNLPADEFRELISRENDTWIMTLQIAAMIGLRQATLDRTK